MLEVRPESDEKNKTKKDGKKSKKNDVVMKEMDVAIAKDSETLDEKVAEACGLDVEKIKCKMVLDTGQGSLKVCVSIFDGDIDPEICFSSQDGPREKLTGVNRLIILAEVEGGQELHYNLRQILERIHLEQLPGLVLVSDLCATNAYLGLSKHGGKFDCYVCEGPATLQSGQLGTFGSICKNYAAYREAGSNPKKMQQFKNVIAPCLVPGEPSELVGEKLPLPELHLLLGISNHFHKLLLKVWPGLEMWGCGKWTIYGWHGRELDGGNSMK